MTDADIASVAAMWEREAREASIDLPWNDIDRALRQLPASGTCAVSDDATALFLLSPTDTLFTVSATGGTVVVTSRPLNADQMCVTLDWAETSQSDLEERWSTHWTFGHIGAPASREHWQEITGSVSVNRASGREQVDDREHFARTIAKRAGWTGYVQGAAKEETVAQQPSTRPGDKPERAEPRWRARTDVWGQPIDPGRR